MHQGEQLRRYLRLNDISVETFMAKVSKSRQTVYNWFEMEILDQETFDKVVIKGKVPANIFDKTKIDNTLNEPLVQYGKDKTPKSPIDMIPKKDYDRLYADYQRLETYCKRLEKRLERYEADENTPKGNERFG